MKSSGFICSNYAKIIGKKFLVVEHLIFNVFRFSYTTVILLHEVLTSDEKKLES